MLTDLRVVGEYWESAIDVPTALGALMAAAKDDADPEALARLLDLVGDDAGDLPAGPDVVVAVPPAPDREAHPVPALAAAVGRARGLPVAPLLRRDHATARLRDADPPARPALVRAAGYRVEGDVSGRHVLLVDDVILTGTTVNHAATLLLAAGAVRIDAYVVCRTRRIDVGPTTAPGGT